jgi:hypothetical protein
VFPELESPPLVPEAIDQEAPLPAEEVMIEEVTIEEVICETTIVERVTVSEHYLAVEHVPERRMKPRIPETVASKPEFVARMERSAIRVARSAG